MNVTGTMHPITKSIGIRILNSTLWRKQKKRRKNKILLVKIEGRQATFYGYTCDCTIEDENLAEILNGLVDIHDLGHPSIAFSIVAKKKRV